MENKSVERYKSLANNCIRHSALSGMYLLVYGISNYIVKIGTDEYYHFRYEKYFIAGLCSWAFTSTLILTLCSLKIYILNYKEKKRLKASYDKAMSKVFTTTEILQIILDIAKSDGFKGSGICSILRQCHYHNGLSLIDMYEYKYMRETLEAYRPFGTEKDSYWWPPTKIYDKTRIEFLENLIAKLKSKEK